MFLQQHTRPGPANLWHAGRFPWYTAFTAVPIFVFLFFRPSSLNGKEYVYVYAHLTEYRLYKIYRCYRITMRINHLHTNREGCEMLTRYLPLRRRRGGDWVNT